MRFTKFIYYIAAIAHITSAASAVETPDVVAFRNATPPLALDQASHSAERRGAPTTPPVQYGKRTRSLLPILNRFVMTPMIMKPGCSTSSTSLSLATMERALSNIDPTTITFQLGSFNPAAILQHHKAVLKADAPTCRVLQTLINGNICHPHPDCEDLDPLSDEDALSDELSTNIRRALNLILRFLRKGSWSQRRSGTSPIEDWRFKSASTGAIKAVLELKTPAALPRADVDAIMDLVANGQYIMLPMQDDPTPKTTFSLTLKGLKNSFTKTRTGREVYFKAMEQVMAEMFFTESRIGVLTNTIDWIVLQRESASSTTLSVTRIEDLKPTEHSEALDIMLAMSLWA